MSRNYWSDSAQFIKILPQPSADSSPTETLYCLNRYLELIDNIIK